MKKPRTEAQKEASRRNGKLSQGPITPEGKRRSCMNALQTGITAATVLLPGECRASWDAHLAAIHGTYQPQDPVEDLAVEAIAAYEWKLRRCWSSECSRRSFLAPQQDNCDIYLDRIWRQESRLNRLLNQAITRLFTYRDRTGFWPGPGPTVPSIHEQLHAVRPPLPPAESTGSLSAPDTPEPSAEPSSYTGRLASFRVGKNEPASSPMWPIPTPKGDTNSPCLTRTAAHS